jgi:CopG family nickel-responsive transcriptional regulator
MERLTISMSDEFAAELATFMASHHYDNRSEAVRDLARLGLKQAKLDGNASGDCIATLSYVFNHHTRDMARRLTDTHHAHHQLQVATLHVHLDHDNCLELAVLRGEVGAVRAFCSGVIAERGVTHGQVSFIPTTIQMEAHPHGDSPARGHTHTHPNN